MPPTSSWPSNCEEPISRTRELPSAVDGLVLPGNGELVAEQNAMDGLCEFRVLPQLADDVLEHLVVELRLVYGAGRLDCLGLREAFRRLAHRLAVASGERGNGAQDHAEIKSRRAARSDRKESDRTAADALSRISGGKAVPKRFREGSMHNAEHLSGDTFAGP